MLRSATLLSPRGILYPRNVIFVQFPRKLRASRILSTRERDCDPTQPSSFPQPCENGSMMDILPIPDCPWQEQYDAKNKEYTKVLIFGAGFFIVTVFVVRKC